MLAALVTRQLVFDGLVSGLVFGLLAMGIVLVYRATRVINFAVGNMGLVGAGLFVLLAVQYGVPYWLALVVALAVGTLYGAMIELTSSAGCSTRRASSCWWPPSASPSCRWRSSPPTPRSTCRAPGSRRPSARSTDRVGPDHRRRSSSILIVVPIVAAVPRRGSSPARRSARA